MKKYILSLVALLTVCTALALPKAIYVVKGENYWKYNFGVAGDLKFKNNGTVLTITGYDEGINLNEIDHITFSAPANTSALTPTESKERLIQIGEEFNTKIDINDNPDILRMIDIFIREYIVNYYLDPKYYDVHTPVPSNIKGVLEGVESMAKGDCSGIRRVKVNGVELYQLSDYFGVFKANTTSRIWEKISDADYLELQFPAANGGMYKARLTQSTEYTDWTEVDFVGRIPRNINVKGWLDNSQLFNIDINSTIDNTAKSADVDILALIGSDYVVKNDMSITNTKIIDDVTLTVRNEKLLTVHSVLNGIELTNYPNWKEDFESTHGSDYVYDPVLDQWIDIEDTRTEMMAGHIVNAVSEIDIMDKLQIKGRVSAIKKLYNILSEDTELGSSKEEWNEDHTELTIIYDNTDAYDRQTLHLNNYSDITFFYDKTSEPQGFVTWEVSEDEYRWYNEDWQYDDATGDYVQVNPHWVRELYYQSLPLLTFPDMTTYAVDDYFNNNNFQALINDYNDILDAYYTISGNEPPYNGDY